MPNLDYEVLATLVKKGAVYCNFKENQIILYESHVPSGIFLITSGEVVVFNPSRKVQIGNHQYVVCDKNILILPSLKHFHHKSSIQAKALRNCNALFIPRSIVLNDKSLITSIEESMLDAPIEWNQ